jgi:hypothetical protein
MAHIIPAQTDFIAFILDLCSESPENASMPDHPDSLEFHTGILYVSATTPTTGVRTHGNHR